MGSQAACTSASLVCTCGDGMPQLLWLWMKEGMEATELGLEVAAGELQLGAS